MEPTLDFGSDSIWIASRLAAALLAGPVERALERRFLKAEDPIDKYPKG